MGDESVPRPGPDTEEPRPGEPELSQAWLECLSEMIQARTEQEFQYRLKTGPELRDCAYRLGPIAGEFGLDSPELFRAVAALITLCHPLVLLAACAAIPTAAPRRAPRAAGTRALRRPRRGGRS
jgi:hypothetical protein